MKKLVVTVFSAFILCAVYGQVRLDSGLVAYYPFNGNANDESGNGNNGVVVGALLTTDRFGNEDAAYEFDGSSTYITIPGSESLQSPIDQLTELAWINLYGWSLVYQPFGPIFMKSNSESNQFQYRLSVGPNGINAAINVWDNFVTIADSLEFNRWYLVAVTWKEDTARFYLDGAFIGKGELVGPAMLDYNPLEIGRDVPGSTEFFYGKIDDARIYNRALTDTEIAAVFEGNLGITENQGTWADVRVSPNPARGTARVLIHCSTSQQVTIRVYNLNGLEVVSLPDETLPPGNYVRHLDIQSLPPGLYIYEMHAGDQAIKGKMVVGR